ncbi:MAG: oligosaccharide flippase family protein [Planctomycetia bacterium]|nr:oligosaccharide flippase family protein [Planctomycetia bacterium]
MSDTQKSLFYLLKGAIYSCGTLFAGVLIGLLLTPYMLSVLGERDYGIYLFAGLFTGWCGLIDFGLTTAASRFITLHYTENDEESLQETGNTALILFAFLGLIVLAVSGLTALFMKIFGGSVPDIDLFCIAVLIAGGSFGISKLGDGLAGIVNGTMRQELTGSRLFLFRILYGITSFLILWCGGRVVALMIGNFLLGLIQFLVFIRLVRIAYPRFRFKTALFRKKKAKALFGYSVYTFITQVGNLMIQRSDLLLILFFLSIEEMTRYNLVVVVFISYFWSFMGALTSWQTNWFTHLYAMKDKDLFQKSLRIFYKLSIYFTFFMSFGLIFLGKAFITRWIGSEYLAVFPCLVLCAITEAVCRGHSEINIRLLQGIARHYTAAWLILIQGVANILLSIVFVLLGLGLFGIALGSAIPALLIHHFILPIFVCQIQKESLFLYYRNILKYQVIAGICLLLPFGISKSLAEPNYGNLFLVGCLSFLIYGAGLYLIGFSPEERRWIKDRFRFCRDEKDPEQ